MMSHIGEQQDFMLPLCRSLQDLFAVQILYRLTHKAHNDFLYHKAFLEVRGLKLSEAEEGEQQISSGRYPYKKLP